MNSDLEYFRCVFEEILPELKSGGITIDAYQEGEDNRMNLSPIPAACGMLKIFFIEGGNTLDSISIPPVAEILTYISPKRICHFSKKSGVSISTAKVLATFKECKRPAIIHEPEKNTIYLLFDLQRLVCGLSKMEIEFGKADKHGRFLAAFLNDESNWKYPILDVFGELMREKSGVSGQQGTPGIVVTHDVDRVGSEPLLLLKNTIKKREINGYHRSEKKDKLFQEIIELAKIDRQHKIKSLWFFLAGKYSLRRYGNRYNINSLKSKKLISVVKENKHTVGLHTSYYAAFNTNAIQSEIDKLAKIFNHSIKIIRNHYLRFDIQKSIPILENCGMKLDSTVGFPDKNGFRAALARPFYFWNHKAHRLSSVLELPLLFMDSVHGDDLATSWDDVLRILFWIKKVNGSGAFLFHPCFFAGSKDKWEFYLNFIRECNSMNIPLVSAEDLLRDRLSKEN